MISHLIHIIVIIIMVITLGMLYCILCGRIKGFNSAIYAIKCQQVVIELWLGSYSTVVG